MPHKAFITITLAAALAAPAVLAQSIGIVEANVKLVEGGDVVPVARIPDGIYLRTVNDPNDIIWDRIPEYRLHVTPAPPVHESVDLRYDYDDEGRAAYFMVARTSDRFYLRMRWRDDTMDTETLRDRFRDGAAVQFSLGDDDTSYIMGDGPDAPVNIWYWRSDNGDVQSLAAGSPGTTTILENQPVSGAAEYMPSTTEGASQWVVVMSREIDAFGDHQVSFDRAQIPIAFAFWQGSDDQRDGQKNVSDGWILAEMGSE